jgi:SAM-dependent methyltransferase
MIRGSAGGSPLPPGTILQFLYLRERLRELPPGDFIEVGTGTGQLTRQLRSLGWRGVGYELSEAAAAQARERNPGIEVRTADWLTAPLDQPADLVISSMVIEHMPAEQERAYLERAREVLKPGGRLALIVPASPRHWGIEDEIAGHQRRYTRTGLQRRLEQLGWRVEHLAGLTYPLSNVLLPISNRIVASAEGSQVRLSALERTTRSGNRNVMGKTSFPGAARLLLNPVVLFPLHLLQKACRNAEGALVLYAEASVRKASLPSGRSEMGTESAPSDVQRQPQN